MRVWHTGPVTMRRYRRRHGGCDRAIPRAAHEAQRPYRRSARSRAASRTACPSRSLLKYA